MLWTCPAVLFHSGLPGKIYPLKEDEEIFQKLDGNIHCTGKQTSKNLGHGISLTRLFQLCDHPQYNHLSQFSCATKQCFNCLELEKTNHKKEESYKNCQMQNSTMCYIFQLSKQLNTDECNGSRKINTLVVIIVVQNLLPEICFDPLQQQLLLQAG